MESTSLDFTGLKIPRDYIINKEEFIILYQEICNTQIVQFDKELIVDVFIQAMSLIICLIFISAILFVIYCIFKKMKKAGKKEK